MRLVGFDTVHASLIKVGVECIEGEINTRLHACCLHRHPQAVCQWYHSVWGRAAAAGRGPPVCSHAGTGGALWLITRLCFIWNECCAHCISTHPPGRCSCE